jgi:hypothetical protein
MTNLSVTVSNMKISYGDYISRYQVVRAGLTFYRHTGPYVVSDNYVLLDTYFQQILVKLITSVRCLIICLKLVPLIE